MNENGYTLSEMLVAMLVIGLMVGGLTQGMRLIGLMQSATTSAAGQAAQLWMARQGFDALLARQGPFATNGAGSGRFDGTATTLSFDCGRATRCGASIEAASLKVSEPSGQTLALPLSNAVQAHFLYGSDGGQTETWPPKTDRREMLRWIALVRGSEAAAIPLMSARVLLDEAPSCEFDTITRDCREAGG